MALYLNVLTYLPVLDVDETIQFWPLSSIETDGSFLFPTFESLGLLEG